MDFNKISSEFEKLSKLTTKSDISKQDRGREFEKLFCYIFENHRILLRAPYYTDDNRSEQIDGAIKIGSRIILLEVKWVESGLAASDLYSFIGKIGNKLEGTLGLFISKEVLSDNFLNAIIKGRRRNIIVLHGEDVDYLFEKDFPIKDYIEFLIELYSYDNILHFPASKYLKQNTIIKDENSTQENNINKDKIKDLISLVSMKQYITEEVFELEIDGFSKEEKIWVLKFILKKYSDYREASEGVYTGLMHYKAINSETMVKILLFEDEIVNDTAEFYFSFIIQNNSIYYLIHYFRIINIYSAFK